MKKKIALSVLTVLCLLLSSTSLGNSADDVDVRVDGVSIQMMVPPIIEQGQMFVPLREISQALGYSVNWEHETGTVYLSKQHNDPIIVNVYPTEAENSPQIVNGRTMVSIRTLAEATGARVTWDQQNHRVIVDKTSSLPFPDTLPHEFQEVEPEEVEELVKIPEDWEKMHSLDLGSFDQTDIVLDLYEVDFGPVPRINGVFTHHDQQFVLTDLARGTTNEVINQNLDLKLGSANDPFRVMAVIGGDYAAQILMFHETEHQWFVLNDWGQLAAAKPEGLIMQFPGRGLNAPNVYLVRFQDDRFITADLNLAFSDFKERLQADMLLTEYSERNGQDEIVVTLHVDGQMEVAAYTIDEDEMTRVHRTHDNQLGEKGEKEGLPAYHYFHRL